MFEKRPHCRTDKRNEKMTGKVLTCHNPLACKDARPCVFTFQIIRSKTLFAEWFRFGSPLLNVPISEGSPAFAGVTAFARVTLRGVNDQKTKNGGSKNN